MLPLARINMFFRRLGQAAVRLRWPVIILFALLAGVCAGGLRLVEAETDQDSWFMEDDELLAAKKRMENIFGNEDFCAALLTAEDVFRPEILRAIRKLGQELKEGVPYAEDVLSLTDLEFTQGVEGGIEITQLVPENIPEDRAALETLRARAMSRVSLKNRMVSEDSTQAWLILRLKRLPKAEPNKEAPVMIAGRAFNRIIHQPEYALLNPRGAGLPVVFVDKLDFFNQETPRLFSFSLLVTALILGVFLRSLRGVLFPILSAGGVLVAVFGMQGFLGVRTDPSAIFMPVFLTLAVSVGYSIHMFNHFALAFAQTGHRVQAVAMALEETGWPLLFSALTTVAALLSFAFIPLRPIRWVGLTSAALVGLACLAALILLPALLSFGRDRAVSGGGAGKLLPRTGRLTQRLMGKTARASLAMSRASLYLLPAIVLVCAWGLTRVEVSFDVLKSFGRRVPYVNRIYEVGQSKVGSIYSYSLALEFDQPGAAKEPENLKKFEELIAGIDELRLTKKTTSILQILKDLNQVLHEGDPAWYVLPESREMAAQLLLLYENAGGLETEKWIDYDYQRLKVMVEMGDYNSGEAARELRWIEDRARELFPRAHVALTGAISQYTVAQDYVSYGQIKSLGAAFAVVTVLMMLVFGSLRLGLISMIPNIAPALAVGGIMGFADIPLDIISVTIMPMLLGLAVDDTIHFINHCQLEFERCGNYAESCQRTFLAVGGALFMTTVILTLNFSVYMVSVVKFFFHMGILVGAGLLAALLADYFVTPALIIRTKAFGPEQSGPAPQG